MRAGIIAIFVIVFHIHARAQTAQLPAHKHPFTVIAHRGDHLLVPENTIAAVENAIADSADYVEIDLRTTKDSVLVIMHDATVDRVTNGKGSISDLSYAQVQGLSILGKNGSDQNYPVPRFDEVLTVCKDRIHIYLDFKNASVKQAYGLIKEKGMERQLIVYINNAHQYQEWRKLAPAVPVMLSLPDTVRNETALKQFLHKYPLEILDGDYSDYTPSMVKTAAEAGIECWPDIQGPEESKYWDKAIRLGLTGLQTDHPAALIAWLKKQGLR